MQSEELAFLAAITADPEDYTRQLAFADFLQERDGPGDAERAELIRVQHEIAKAPYMGAKHNDPRYVWPHPWGAIRNRQLELESRLSSWPCPECKGRRQVRLRATGIPASLCPLEACSACGGSGDVLRTTTVNGGRMDGSLSLLWRGGRVVTVLLPGLRDCLRLATYDETPIGLGEIPLLPTARLAALCGTPPRGEKLEAVIPEDRLPRRIELERTAYVWDDGEDLSQTSNLPLCLFTTDKALYQNHPTPKAAKFALGRVIHAFGERGWL